MRFKLGPSMLSHTVHVMCDYPEPGQTFQRGKFQELEWSCNHNDQFDPDRHADLVIKSAGTYRFHYFATDNLDEYVMDVV